MSSMLLLPILLFMGRIDFEDAQIVFLTRCGFAAAQTFVLLGLALAYYTIQGKNNQKKLRVKAKQLPSMGAPPPENPDAIVEVTVMDHDMAHLKAQATKTLSSLAIISLLHYQWGMMQPLFIQALLTPLEFCKGNLFLIHCLGLSDEKRERPWKSADENPFAALMGKKDEDEAPVPQAGSNADEEPPKLVPVGPKKATITEIPDEPKKPEPKEDKPKPSSPKPKKDTSSFEATSEKDSQALKQKLDKEKELRRRLTSLQQEESD